MGKDIHHAVQLGELMIALLLGVRERDLGVDVVVFVAQTTDCMCILARTPGGCQSVCLGVAIVLGFCLDGIPHQISGKTP